MKMQVFYVLLIGFLFSLGTFATALKGQGQKEQPAVHSVDPNGVMPMDTREDGAASTDRGAGADDSDDSDNPSDSENDDPTPPTPSPSPVVQPEKLVRFPFVRQQGEHRAGPNMAWPDGPRMPPISRLMTWPPPPQLQDQAKEFLARPRGQRASQRQSSTPTGQ